MEQFTVVDRETGVEGDATVEYEPGDEGYLQTVADSLPYPLEPAEWPEEPPLDDGAGDSSVE